MAERRRKEKSDDDDDDDEFDKECDRALDEARRKAAAAALCESCSCPLHKQAGLASVFQISLVSHFST